MHRRLYVAAMLAAGALAITGCKSGGSKDTTTSSDAATQSTAAGTLQHGDHAKPVFKPNFKGLYYTPEADDTGTRSFVRYFEKQGVACEAGQRSDQTPDDVRTWMEPGNSMVSDGYCGPYDAAGNFSTSKNGKVDFKVLNSSATTVVIQSTSYIPGYEGKKPPRSYVFSAD